MAHQRDMDEMMAAISEEETLEAQLEEAQKRGAAKTEVRRLGGLLNAVLRREVEAEGEADD
jgi:hypothetical protein